MQIRKKLNTNIRMQLNQDIAVKKKDSVFTVIDSTPYIINESKY